jgi:phage baseplate assembly protein W
LANNIYGISYPFRVEGAGLPAKAVGRDVIKSALITLLKTPKGSRVMRPTLGTNIHKLLFENVGPLLHPLIEREILTAIRDELPMVVVTGINMNDDNNKVTVNIFYQVQGVSEETGAVELSSGR